METIIASYSVCDCEHRGDIERAKCEVREAGGTVLYSEWDGHDCGEAYVYCEISKEKFEKELEQQDYSWHRAEYLRDWLRSKGLVK